MEENQIERRFLQTPGPELRLLEGADKKPRIVGYAAVFNVLSVPLFGFREKIAPACFRQSLVDGDDVRALVNHEPSQILGRRKNETLKLREDPKGLQCEIDPPDTATGHDAVESVRRGDIDSMSFGFRVRKDLWETDGKENTRTLLDVKLFDVSLATFPAYPQTKVALRSLFGLEESEEEALAATLVRATRDLPLTDADRERLASHGDWLTYLLGERLASEELPALETRPYSNEHAARLRSPDDFDKATFRRTAGGTIYGKIKVPASVGIIWGKLTGASKPSDMPHPQALRFPTKDWTEAAARKWLKDNGVKFLAFEPASGEAKTRPLLEEARARLQRA